MQPWPTAYTYWHRPGKPPLRLIVLKAGPQPTVAPAAPGTVVAASAEHVAVAAGSGAVSLLTVQPAGKKPMPIADFLRGHLVQVGERFGPETL
jgi:methionyl-tRNA formyltransferase